jgi:diguanylate cyclase (GGDEF)-like protein
VNISPSALLAIVVATTIANILILVMISLRNKNNRSRRLAAVETILSASYFEGGPGAPRPGREADEDASGGPLDPVPPQALEDASDGMERTDGPLYEEAWVAMEREAYAEAGAETAEDTGAGDADVEGHRDPTEGEVDGDEGVVDADELNGSHQSVEAERSPAADPPVREAAETASIVGRDSLTGLRDAPSFKEVLAYEDAREQRYGRPATVVVFELDGLPRIVERLGPNAGDRIEVALADTIGRLARRADYVARLEPGRYGVLLPETDEVAAINYVERIRRACDLWLESGAIAMRLAIGWASTGGDVELAAAIRTATDRLRLESRRNARAVGDEDAADDAGGVVAEAVGVGESSNRSNGL